METGKQQRRKENIQDNKKTNKIMEKLASNDVNNYTTHKLPRISKNFFQTEQKIMTKPYTICQ